ncbi:MAG: P-loop NTPase fold protein [Cyanobacteria bacterium P01_H01_bin.21]
MTEQTWTNDQLGRQAESQALTNYFINRFAAAESNDEYGKIVLNINAEWGLGKTFFLTNWAKDLEVDGFPVVYFDAWQNDFSDEPLLGFIHEVDTSLKPYLNNSPNALKLLQNTVESGKKLIKPSLPILLSILIKKSLGLSQKELQQLIREMDNSDEDIEPLEENIAVDNTLAQSVATIVEKASAERLKEHKNIKSSILTFRKNLTQLTNYIDQKLTSKSLPIFVFVDELDRCRPNYAIELLENIKHLFGVRGVYFIVATDSKQLGHSVRAVYGNKFDSEKYLKRFFDQEYTFLNPDTLNFSKFLFNKFKLDTDGTFFSPLNDLIYAYDDPGIPLFSLFSSYFRLSLRDQEQVCSMLNAIRFSHQDKKFHLGYLLFLIMLRQVSNKAFEAYVRGDGMRRNSSLSSFYTSYGLQDKIDARINFRTYATNTPFNREKKIEEISLEKIIDAYIKFSMIDILEINIDRGRKTDDLLEIHEIRQELIAEFLSSYRKEDPPKHNLSIYPSIVKQAGQFS